MTSWKPDTCGCAFDVAPDWGSGVPVTQCPFHSAIPSADVFAVVIAENKLKNQFLTYVLENTPAALLNGKPPTASSTEWASAYGISGDVTFNADRQLSYKSDGLLAADISSLQAYADSTWGAGKIQVT